MLNLQLIHPDILQAIGQWVSPNAVVALCRTCRRLIGYRTFISMPGKRNFAEVEAMTLEDAVEFGVLEIIRWKWEAYTDSKRDVVYMASMFGRIDLIQIFVQDWGILPSYDEIAQTAIMFKQLHILKWCFEDLKIKITRETFYFSYYIGDIESVNYLRVRRGLPELREEELSDYYEDLFL